MARSFQMQRLQIAAIALVGLASAFNTGAQAPDTTLCDGIVTRVRAAAGQDAWELLTRDAAPFIDLRRHYEGELRAISNAGSAEESSQRFIARFRPASDLLKAWTDALGTTGGGDIGSLAGSDLHVITTSGGSMLCYSFRFFRAPPGGQARLLPDVPAKSDRDGDRAICNKSGGDGYLARVGGVEAFVETWSNDTSQYIRIVPLQGDRWSGACAVSAEYAAEYATTKAFVAAGGPVTEADMRVVAAQLVARREAVEEAKEFSFGPPLSPRELDRFQAMTKLIATQDGEPMPTFGRDADLSAGEETLRSVLQTIESLPVLLDGHAYLLRIGHGQLGCCHFPGSMLVLYTRVADSLQPVASAVVARSRGRLKSVSVSASR